MDRYTWIIYTDDKFVLIKLNEQSYRRYQIKVIKYLTHHKQYPFRYTTDFFISVLPCCYLPNTKFILYRSMMC